MSDWQADETDWQPSTSAAGLTFVEAPSPAERPACAANDGDWVSALVLEPVNSDRVIVPRLLDRRVSGMLVVEHVALTDLWRFSVGGQTVDPASVTKATE